MWVQERENHETILEVCLLHLVISLLFLFSHSVVSDSLRPNGLQHGQASLSFTISWSLLKLMSIESVMPSNHLILCYPLLLLPSVFPSIRVFSNGSARHIRWPKYWSFSFSISPSNEYSELIAFRIYWFDLLAVHETLKSLLQHHTWKVSVLQCSAFFMVQHSHPYMTTGKTTVLTIWTFVGKVMSLLFNMLPRFVVILIPRSKRLFFFFFLHVSMLFSRNIPPSPSPTESKWMFYKSGSLFLFCI